MAHLAQINVGKIVAPLDSQELKEFVDNLEPVNAIADAAPGFIWRLQDESGDATQIQVFDDPDIIVNMSTWQDLDSLKNFMFKTLHRDFLKRRREWFTPDRQPTYALWWVAERHQPSVQEGVERLLYLREHGASQYAFDFANTFLASE